MSANSQVWPSVTLEVGIMQVPLVHLEKPADKPLAKPQYTVPEEETAEAFMGATESIEPTLGMVVVTVRAGLPAMAGAEPSGQLLKKGLERRKVSAGWVAEKFRRTLPS